MIILLEGPDGAGKTTLAQRLSDMTGYKVEHFSYPKNEEDFQNMCTQFKQLCASRKNLIVDRCWYSEMVYGPIMRHTDHMDVFKMYEYERDAVKVGALLIYCTGQEAALWKRLTVRGEDYVASRDDFKAICKRYDDIMSLPHYIPVLKYEAGQW